MPSQLAAARGTHWPALHRNSVSHSASFAQDVAQAAPLQP
jgi:hypothetical protein